MSKRILVAGIGNVFLGDDGFGVEVVKRVAGRELPEGVEVVDFGIRGMDLAYALQEEYELVVFVDATPRGQEPSTVYLIEPEIEEDGEVSLDTHGMDPVKVIKLSRALGARPRSEEHTSELQSRQYLVCCLLLEKTNTLHFHRTNPNLTLVS